MNEEIKEYLRDNLEIQVSTETDCGNSFFVIKLVLEGKCISSDGVLK